MIKVLKSHFTSVAFSTETLKLYPLPEAIENSLSNDEIMASDDSRDHIKSYDHQARITGVVLLTAQTCNLQCSYCFAKAYMASSNDKPVMSSSTACIAIEKILEAAPDTRSVLFFGGEPLIGFAAIKEAVRASERFCMAHQTQMPAFSINTNGTLIDQEMVGFFKKHNVSVTISLDGPKHVNDKQRQFPTGKGTYEIVKQKIDLLRDSGIEIRIEAVFTENHTKCHETIESTYDFLRKCGARDIYLTPAIGGSSDESLDETSLVDLENIYASSTERIMDSWLTDSPIRTDCWLSILYTLISRKVKTRFCGAGYDRITVDWAGKVYPCYSVMSDSFCMGSVYDKDFPGEKFGRVRALMCQTSKNSFPKCAKCWAKALCSPCYGDTFASVRSLSAQKEGMCVRTRAVAKATVLKVAEFMTDDEKWKKFLENINRSNLRFDVSC